MTLSSLAFDPEETRFIFTRCVEQYSTSSTEDDSSRLPRIRRWISWSLEAAEDEQTKCFVACLLNKLKLWQPYLGKFRVSLVLIELSRAFGGKVWHIVQGEQLQLQHDLYNSYVNWSREDVEVFAAGVERTSDVWNCQAVYEGFTVAIAPQIEMFKQLFLLDDEVAASIYADLVMKINVWKWVEVYRDSLAFREHPSDSRTNLIFNSAKRGTTGTRWIFGALLATTASRTTETFTSTWTAFFADCVISIVTRF